MTTPPTPSFPPLRKTVRITASPERPFRQFTEAPGTWWPRRSHSVVEGSGVRRAWYALALLLSVAGCHRAARTSPGPEPAATACPAPALDTRAWRHVADSAGVSYRLPPSLLQRPDTAGPHREWDGADAPHLLTVGFIHAREHWITLRRVPSPGMLDMSECIDSIPGREILVQTWRMAGGVFRDLQRLDKYDMFALVPIEPGLTLFLTGGGPERETQILLLAVARTVRVAAR